MDASTRGDFLSALDVFSDRERFSSALCTSAVPQAHFSAGTIAGVCQEVMPDPQAAKRRVHCLLSRNSTRRRILESKSSRADIKPDEPNQIESMNTLYLKLLVLLYGLALTAGAGLLAAESPAPGGLAEDAPSTRSVSSPPVDPGATAGPQTSPKTPNSSRGAAQAIPILLVVFGCPVAIVGLVAYFRARKQKQLHETLRAMIEKDIPIPPELLRSPAPTGDASEPDRADPQTALRQGLFLVALGVGICVWLLIKSSDSWGLGFIPFLIGLSFLAEWQLEKRNPSKPE